MQHILDPAQCLTNMFFFSVRWPFLLCFDECVVTLLSVRKSLLGPPSSHKLLFEELAQLKWARSTTNNHPVAKASRPLLSVIVWYLAVLDSNLSRQLVCFSMLHCPLSPSTCVCLSVIHPTDSPTIASTCSVFTLISQC